jgi:hypothetical protein
MRETNIGDRVIGYYAGRTASDRFWWKGAEMLELMLWSSPIEAHRYLVRTGVAPTYHNFYPVEFGELMVATERGIPYRLSRLTMQRFLDTWREDFPKLPATAFIDLGAQEFVQWPPIQAVQSSKAKKRTLSK